MRLRIHHPLFGGFLGVVALLVVLVVILVGTGLRRELIGLMRTELTRELRLAEMVVAAAPAGFAPDSLAGALADRVGHRVTLIAADGDVVGDSEVPAAALDEVENHRQRPEILASDEGVIGFAERSSGTVGVPFLYAALRTDGAGGVQYVRVAATMAEIGSTLARASRAVALAGGVAMALALIVAYLVSRALARPLVLLSDRAQRLAAGDLSTRAPRSTRVQELDELALAFNRLADELQARLDELGQERDEIQELLDCMAEGVIALTPDGTLLRTNRAADELLGISEPPLHAPVREVVGHPRLADLLEASLARPAATGEITLGDRNLIVSTRQLDQGGGVTTLLDVTEIRRLEQVRQDFVANASHELKTPLTSMRGFAETLLEDDPPPELRHEFLTSIHNNTVRLQRLVDDLLDLSRLESGGWRAGEGPVDVAEVAARAWDDLDGGTPRRRIRFSLQGDGVAWADEQGVEQVLRNLLDNARRYTPDGGSIAVRIRTTPPPDGQHRGRVWVDVADSGSGIPEASLPRIFERFYRADTSRARQVGGTGLGLAIVRHLVQGMGGEVSAQSAPGDGTTLRFHLPRAEASP